MDTKEVLQSSARGASYMMLLVMAQRLITFLFNTFLLRLVPVEVVGFASNEMELLIATLLFLSREACRLVALRAPTGTLKGDNAVERQQLVNMAWLPVPVGLLLAGGAAAWRANRAVATSSSATTATSVEDWAFYIYCAAAAVETVAEPFFILSQSMLLYGARAGTEMAATVLRAVLSLGAAVAALRLNPEQPATAALAFAAGQLVYGVVLLLGFMRAAGGAAPSLSALLPRRVQSVAAGSGSGSRSGAVSALGSRQLNLWLGFTGQSVVKHVLTEGDRLLLVLWSDRASSGAYAVTQNYGSLAPRLLFQPIEEALRGLVAKLVPHQPAATGQVQSGSSKGTEGLAVALRVYTGVLRLVTLAGLLFAALGSAYSHTLVQLALGQKWTDAGVPFQLALYCVYVLFLALNGVIEAFASSAADASRLHSANAHLLVAFGAYTATVAALFPRIGTAALIVAGCVNMSMRIASAWRYAVAVSTTWSNSNAGGSSGSGSGSAVQPLRLSSALPATPTLAVFALAAAAVHASNYVAAGSGYTVAAHARHVAVGCVAGCAVLASVWRWERRQLAATWATLKGRDTTAMTDADEQRECAPVSGAGAAPAAPVTSPSNSRSGRSRSRAGGTAATATISSGSGSGSGSAGGPRKRAGKAT